MIPNINPQYQVNRNTYQPQSTKLIGQIPPNKQNQNMATIKKIQNFSYALSDEIGLGLTARVYKGKNDLTGKPVAIKCVDLKSHKDTLNQEFLKEEISTLEKIKQNKANYLLSLEGVILTSNHLYIITEFCEGKDMAKILRQKKVLTQQQAQSVMRQMIRGYRELYSMGLIHRDLKLSNLFVTHGKIKLADFGFAISEDKCNYSFGYNAGSPKYMPPQSLRFNKYSFKSDAWAMGIIAFELVYGHAPWKHKDDAKLYQLTTTVPIDTLFDPNISVSDHYKTFIVNCLQPNIGQRANPDFIFNYSWPLAQDFVQGFEEEIKIPEKIIVPGKNYAVFSSSNQISYESKQLDTEDFVNNASMPTQFVLLSQLNYCRFLMNIYKCIKAINNQNNQLLTALNQQISITVQIIMKILGEIACMQKNRLQTPDFDTYIKRGEWQNLKQIIIRYDIEFRGQLQSTQHMKKGAMIPKTAILPQTISYLKQKLPQNVRLLDKLITYLEIRQIYSPGKHMEFAERVNMAAINKEALVPDNQYNCEVALNRIGQRLAAVHL